MKPKQVKPRKQLPNCICFGKEGTIFQVICPVSYATKKEWEREVLKHIWALSTWKPDQLTNKRKQ